MKNDMPDEKWWERKPFKLCWADSDWFDIEKIISEAVRHRDAEILEIMGHKRKRSFLIGAEKFPYVRTEEP